MSAQDPGTGETRREAFEHRLAALRAVLESTDRDGVLLERRRDFAWLTAGGSNHVVLASETGVASLLVTPDRIWVVTPAIEARRIDEEETGELGIEIVSVPWWEPGAAAEAARRLGGPRLAREADLEDALIDLRSRLSPLDRRRLHDLGAAATEAVTDSLATVVQGAAESDLAAALTGRLHGVRSPVVLVAADERIDRFRHPIPTDTPIHDRVMLVLVAEQWGLHVAVTRFREFSPPGAELQRRWDAVGAVQQAMHDATVPGATLGDVIRVAQAGYAEAGLGEEWRDHHQGGTIAYQGRERVAVPGDAHIIEAGMAFAWNPSITGVKLEDTILLEDDGGRRIVTQTGQDETGD